MRQVLQCLCNNHLYANMTKCEFFQSEVKYLGHVISADEGSAVDPSKIQDIGDWPTLINVGEIHSCMGLACYYHQFVQGFLNIAFPITALQRKGNNFLWLHQCEATFQILKEHLTSAPILVVLDPLGDFVV